MTEQHTEAIAMNSKFDKDARAQSRAEKITAAKDRLASYGRATLDITKRAIQLTKVPVKQLLSALIAADKFKSGGRPAPAMHVNLRI